MAKSEGTSKISLIGSLPPGFLSETHNERIGEWEMGRQ